MDPLRLIEIAQDEDFPRVRQLVHENFPVSPEPTEQQQQKRMQKRDHPWKSPIQRYRNKQLSASVIHEEDDDDLEELSWKHRSKAYDLRKSDVTRKRVYHSDEENDDPSHLSDSFQQNGNESSYHYTDRRPESIEIASSAKIVDDEQVITPATIPMDEDEFDSPFSDSTPTSVSLLDSSSPSVATPPEAILDQLDMDHKENSGTTGEGTEVTLDMFQEEMLFQDQLQNIQKKVDPKRVEGAVKDILERRSGVKKLIEEHERLIAETKKTIAVIPDRNAKSKKFENHKSQCKETDSHPNDEEEGVVDGDVGDCSEDKVVDFFASIRENKAVTEEQFETKNDGKIDELKIVIDFEDEKEEEIFLQRSSILTTIAEESTPLKVPSPRTISSERFDKDSKITDTRKDFRALDIISPEKIQKDTKVTNTRKEFKEMRIKQLNKVTIAAALIELNAILTEESKSLFEEIVTNDSRLIKAIVNHRKAKGFFTSFTPTHEGLKNGAAAIIQASCRKFLAIRLAKRKVETAKSFAAILIQTQWRACDSRMNYKWHRGSAVILQAKWKAWLLRKQFNSLRSSIILVQSIARMHHFKTKFLQQKSSAISFQNKWRSHSCLKRYHSLRSSAIFVQSIARMHQCQKEYFEQKESAITFQTNWRSYSCKNQYELIRSSTIMIQSIARMYQSRTKYHKCKSSAQIVQTKWRSYSCQKQFKSMRSSSILIQSVIRMQQCQNKFLQFEECVRIAQTKWRSHNCQKRYKAICSSSILAQSIARMHQCRSRFLDLKASLTSIQATSRMYHCRKKYLECKKAATTLQSASRMHFCNVEYQKLKRAVTYLQAAVRMHICVAKYHQCKKSMIQLQSLTRMHLCHAQYRDKKRVIVILQAAQRMTFSRSKYVQYKKAATMLQSFSRMRILRANYVKQKSASTTLQASSRMYLCRSNYVQSKGSVIIVQAKTRAYLCRTMYLKQQRGAILLQGVIRMFLLRGKYLVHKIAAPVVQHAFREYMRQKDHATFEAIREIQGRWRSSVYRSDHMALREIKKISTSHRTSICKSKFMLYLSSSIIQRGWRNYIDRKTFEAAQCIQAKWRAVAFQKRWNAIKVSTLLIQTRWRVFSCQKDYDKKLMLVTHAQLNIEYDDDEGAFLGRSSTLTTIVEERSPLTFASPSLGSPSMLSDQFEDDCEEQKLPTTIKKKKRKAIVEKNLQEDSHQAKDDPVVPVRKSGVIENRKASEERLMALAAKVAKRRASLDRNRPKLTTRDPWQKQIELQKTSRPVLLSKRMGELKKLANQKRVSSSRWNTNEELNNQAAGVANRGSYPNVLGNHKINDTRDNSKNDSIVKKLFELDGHDHVVSNTVDVAKPISKNDTKTLQEIDGVGDVHSEISIKDEMEEAINLESDYNVKDCISDEMYVDAKSSKVDVSQNKFVWNEESEYGEDNYAGYEGKTEFRSWRRRSIVDDLADDVYDIEIDSDSDYESLSSDDMEQKRVNDHAGDNGTTTPDRIGEIEESIRPTRIEWSVVDDLIDDEDIQLDETLDMEDDDYFDENSNSRKNEVSFQSPVALSKIQKEHPLWSINGEGVSETLSSSFYTVAGIAASVIGMGD